MGEAANDSKVVRASSVAGTEVYGESGEHLGHVEDLVIGQEDGRVRFAVMSFGGFLGIGEEFHPLPWPLLRYEPRRRVYVVPLDREQIEGAPRFGSQDEPDWSDELLHRNVYTYYGQPALA